MFFNMSTLSTTVECHKMIHTSIDSIRFELITVLYFEVPRYQHYYMTAFSKYGAPILFTFLHTLYNL